MTEHMLVLVMVQNKIYEEIINESFCPQVERIKNGKLGKKRR